MTVDEKPTSGSEPSLGSTGLPSPSDDAPMLGGDALAQLLPVAYREEILRLLRSPSVHDRWDAWLKLKDLGEDGAPGLITFMLRDRSPYIRSQTIAHLRTTGTHLATQALISALQGDESSTVREQAALALAEKPESIVAKTLITALKDDKSPTVRKQAALALGDKPENITVAALLNAAKHDDHQSVRRACWSALAQLGELAVGDLAAALQDADLRLDAAKQLSRIGDESAVARVLEIFPDLTDSECYPIIDTLASRHSDPISSLLLNFLRTSGSRYYNLRELVRYVGPGPFTIVNRALNEMLVALGETPESIQQARLAWFN